MHALAKPDDPEPFWCAQKSTDNSLGPRAPSYAHLTGAERRRAVRRAWKKKKNKRATYRLIAMMRAVVRRAAHGKGARSSYLARLGYGPEELRAHLERQFTDGMSWENIRDWDVDHVRPLASFNLTWRYDEAFMEAWSLSNLQPLWRKENREKWTKWKQMSCDLSACVSADGTERERFLAK